MLARPACAADKARPHSQIRVQFERVKVAVVKSADAMAKRHRGHRTRIAVVLTRKLFPGVLASGNDNTLPRRVEHCERRRRIVGGDVHDCAEAAAHRRLNLEEMEMRASRL